MKQQKTRSYVRLAWSLAIVVLSLAVLTAPRAVDALQKLFGYVPGIGFVESNNALRMVVQPVTVEKNGVTITIEKGTTDSQRTVLLAKIEGYEPIYDETPLCFDMYLLLEDGTKLHSYGVELGQVTGKGDPWSGLYGKFEFEPIPAGVLKASLEAPCLFNEINPTGFTFPLQFRVADLAEVIPVIELQTLTPPSTPVVDSGITNDFAPQGFAIVIESEASLEDGYIITGHYQWSDPRYDLYDVTPLNIQASDANGKPVNFAPTETITSDVITEKKQAFAFQIIGKDYTFPLTFTVDALSVLTSNQATFEFDAGTNPQVGQSWDVNLDVTVGTQVIRIKTIHLIAGRTPTELGFNFEMSSGTGASGATVADANPIINATSGGGGGGGGGGGTDTGPYVHEFSTGWVIDGYVPAGTKTFIVSDVIMNIAGIWQTIWSPSSP